MSDSNNNMKNPAPQTNGDPILPTKRKKGWKTALKWTAVTIFSLIALLIILISAAVWILTPQKLTSLTEKYGSEYLNADVCVKKVELTFWSTFPHLTLEVDSLSIRTRNVPEEYRDLFSVDNLHGTVNLLSLLKYSFELKDLYIGHPQAKLVVMKDGKTNFDIIPPSDSKEEKDKTQVPPPSISFNRFLIEDAGPLRYISLQDSVDISVNVANLNIGGEDMPEYMLGISSANSLKTPLLSLDSLAIGLNGKISFDLKKPDRIELQKISFEVDSFRTDLSAKVEFGDTITLRALEFSMPDWQVSRIIELMPEKFKKPIKGIKTDLTFTLEGKLGKPYGIVPGDTAFAIPAMDLNLDIPSSSLKWRRLRLNRIEIAASASTSPEGLDKTKIEISRFIVAAKNIGLGIKGKISDPLSNPRFDGTVKGKMNLTNLPTEVYSKFAKTMDGVVIADIRMRASASDFSPKRFHRIFIDGKIDLRNISFKSADSLTNIFTEHSELHFGSNIRFMKRDGAIANDLLCVSVKGDTMSCSYGKTSLTLSDFTVGAGTKVMKNRRDSTVIPLGGVVRFSRLRLTDLTDSLTFAMRDATCNASITQFADNARKPLVNLVFDNRFLFGGVPSGRVGLVGAHIDMTATFRERRHRNSDMTDSARIARRKLREAEEKLTAGGNPEQLDMEVDSGIQKILNKWNISGSIRAKGGRAFLRSIPAAHIIRNIDLSFTTDTIKLKDLSYELGNSDFLVNGTVSNLRRALTRKRRNTIGISFDIKSDTIDVNFLSALAMQGGELFIPENEDEAERLTNSAGKTVLTIEADTVPMEALIIPSNIDGSLRVKAENLIYTDFIFKKFRGNIRILESAAQLRNLSATSSIGKINLTALYSAPNKNNIEFGMGMKVDKFYIERMIKLIPAIDSLMPMIKDFSGIINADLAATAKVDSTMNIVLPSLQAALKLSGDSLVLLDADTFKSLSKWLFFKNKKHNMIDSMAVEMTVSDNVLQIYPFIFNIDRYRLGVMGSNDLAMNLNYHISVLKSPLPFKFGINIKGNVDDMKIRLGGAKFKNNMVAERISIADTTRINLVNQIENIFRRSARSGLRLRKAAPENVMTDEPSDTLTAEQKIMLEGQ